MTSSDPGGKTSLPARPSFFSCLALVSYGLMALASSPGVYLFMSLTSNRFFILLNLFRLALSFSVSSGNLILPAFSCLASHSTYFPLVGSASAASLSCSIDSLSGWPLKYLDRRMGILRCMSSIVASDRRNSLIDYFWFGWLKYIP